MIYVIGNESDMLARRLSEFVAAEGCDVGKEWFMNALDNMDSIEALIRTAPSSYWDWFVQWYADEASLKGIGRVLRNLRTVFPDIEFKLHEFREMMLRRKGEGWRILRRSQVDDREAYLVFVAYLSEFDIV